jgi:SAM-dependent methyltransferase
MLEIGTSGVLPAALSTLAPSLEVEVTNFDPDEAVHHSYLDRFGNEHSAVRVDLEFDSFPYNDESFDWVLCCEVLEHMEIDPMFMLSEVNRILKPGGRMLLTTPNVVSSTGLHKMLLGLEPYLFMQYHRTREYHRHNYEYSIHTLYQVLKAAGFTGKLWTEDTFEDGRPSTIDRLTRAGFTIQHTGDNIIALCEKEGPVLDRYPVAIYV